MKLKGGLVRFLNPVTNFFKAQVRMKASAEICNKAYMLEQQGKIPIAHELI
ncbi:MAG: hypothetical protein K0S29_919 [Gammaproteobacteria bacterium]|jgi:hypothetical protein|nr:hypothetical protein [Gammaproteobacteria bacterium]